METVASTKDFMFVDHPTILIIMGDTLHGRHLFLDLVSLESCELRISHLEI